VLLGNKFGEKAVLIFSGILVLTKEDILEQFKEEIDSVHMS
jgi:hypothetical protein